MDDAPARVGPDPTMGHMLLRLHLPSAEDGPGEEVAARAEHGATLGDVIHLLGGGPAADVLLAGDDPVTPDALLGEPPLLDGVVLTRPSPPPDAAGAPVPSAPPVARLHVVAGPAAGSVHDLPAGRHVLGRGAGCDIVVADPRVSRRHAALQLDPVHAEVVELDSTNGTSVDGQDVAPSASVRPGSRIRFGDTVAVLRSPADAPASLSATGAGTLALNRRPRLTSTEPHVVIEVPGAPTAPDDPPLSLITLLLPLAVSALAAVALDNPLFLLFGLMAPVLALGQNLGERRRRRRAHRADLARHDATLRRAAGALDRAAGAELDRRRAACPDLARVLEVAVERLEPLWERRRDDLDLLAVGLGRATLTATCSVRPAGGTAQHPRLADAPLSVRLDQAGVLGVSGPRGAALALARGVVGQVAVWTSPREVGLWLLCARASGLADWRWATALPHALGSDDDGALVRCAALGADEEQLRRRVETLLRIVRARRRRHPSVEDGPEGTTGGPAHLVVLDDAGGLRDVPGMAEILAHGPEVGVYALCVASRAALLPGECRATVDVTEDSLVAVGDVFPVARQARPDLTDRAWGPALARALAPVRDPTVSVATGEGGALPERVDLLDLLDVDATDPHAVAAAWSARPRTTRSVLGTGSQGIHRLDLAHDGPHLLIGGMTGSGKSELLRTLITSFAAVNRPDELGFVLVDYKGGSAFDDCATLPHVLGLVTDLDASLTVRALTSLRAELRRREETFRRAGVTTHEGYAARRDADPTRPPLPRLVIVVDEFRALAEEHPDFVTGLVRIATLGRSLGVHLVLATQRPAGIVSAEIKANANLRIALRVRDRGDSYDVIEADAAAALPSSAPGRALLRTGGGDLVAVQVAHVATVARRSRLVPTATRLDLSSLGEAPPAPHRIIEEDAGPGALQSVVAATRAACNRLRIPQVDAPWLPPLPDRLDADSLVRDEPAPPPCDRPGCSTPAWLTHGLLDDPEHQRRLPLRLDLRSGGNLAIIGTGRTGRTGALRTLTDLVAAHACPAAVHLHVVDSTGGLDDLAARRDRGDLPHLGTHVGAREPGRLRRFVARLLGEVRARESGGTDGVTAAGRPVLLVLVDGWDRLRDVLEPLEHGDVLREWHEVLRTGPSVDVRVVLTGDRSLLLGSIAALFGDRLLLRLADPGDVLLAGLPAGSSPPPVPGRARRLGDGLEAQLAQPHAAARREAGDHPAVRGRDHAACATVAAGPWSLRPLPNRVASTGPTPDKDDDDGTDTRARLRSTIGLTADSLERAHVDLGHGFLVVGPRRSGRTTALAALVEGAAGIDTVAWVSPTSPERSQASTPTGASASASVERPRVVWVDPHDVDALRGALAAPGRTVVVGDDVDRWWDTPVEEALAAIVRRRDVPVLVAGTTRDVAERFRGLPAELRRGGAGLVLHAAWADREVFGVPLPTGEADTPGRGVLVSSGRAVALQVADAGTDRRAGTARNPTAGQALGP